MLGRDQHPGPPAELPLTFQLDDETFTLPRLTTRVWLDALVLQPPGNWWHLLPMRLAEDQAVRIVERMFDGNDQLDLDDVEAAAVQVLGAALGMDFHAASRLAVSVFGNWVAFDGWCWSRGVSPLEQPISRLVAAAYTWRRSLCAKEAELHRLDAEIWAPPPSTTASGRPRETLPGWSEAAEESAFLAMLGSVGARGRG